MIKFLGQKEGGMDKLKGKKIVHLYHDSAFGKEPIPVLEALATKHRLRAASRLAVPHPGNEQQSQWLQIRQAKPDYVILWGWGVMNPTALKTAAQDRLPAREDPRRLVVGLRRGRDPGGRRRQGLLSAAFSARAPVSR